MERGLHFSTADAGVDDTGWSARSEYWSTYKPRKKKGPPKKYKFRQPLILCGHGARINVDRGTLLVRNGFTYYPQKLEEFRFFPGDPNLPDRIIILDASGGITFDALSWMSEQEISLLQLDWRGRPKLMGGPAGYSADPKIVDAQRAAQGGKKKIEISRWLIREKLIASNKTLLKIIPNSENRKNAILEIEKWISEIKNSNKSNSLPKIHGIEGQTANVYFSAWRGIPLNWSGLKKKPIPDNWLEIGPRTMGWRKRSRAARHPINAMLNYGYGILISQLQAQVSSAGLDPTIGMIHGNSENRIPLIYDLMEPLRPVVDSHILGLALEHTFSPGDFTINKSGGCRLNPQMAKTLVKQLDFPEAELVVRDFVSNLMRRAK